MVKFIAKLTGKGSGEVDADSVILNRPHIGGICQPVVLRSILRIPDAAADRVIRLRINPDALHLGLPVPACHPVHKTLDILSFSSGIAGVIDNPHILAVQALLDYVEL